MSLDVNTVVDAKIGPAVSSTIEDVKRCKAILTWSDESSYTGIVVVEGSRLGSITGKGVFRSDQGILEGQFVSGKLEGKGKRVLPNGNIFEGLFVNGRREGKGKLTQRSDNTVVHGSWQNDKLNGWALKIYSSGCLERAVWINDVKDPWTVRREFAPGLRPLIVYMYAGAYTMQPFFESLADGLNLPWMSPLDEAYTQLCYTKNPTQVQKNLKTLMERGECPRRPIVELTRRQLERFRGCGVLVNFPETVEEAGL